MTGTDTASAAELDGRGEFRGWPADALAFLDELAQDNTRRFWTDNADRYRLALREPTRVLAAALAAELGPRSGPPRVFRPHVDRRFRPQDDPYRTDTGVAVAGPGGTPHTLVLSTRGLAVQVGHQRFDPGQLRRYRAAVDGGAGAELVAVLGVLHAAGLVPDRVPTLVGRPRGCPRDHPRLALMRLCGLHVDRAWPAGEWLATRQPLDRVREAWSAARPLADWLDGHVGPRAERSGSTGAAAGAPRTEVPAGEVPAAELPAGAPDGPVPRGTADHDPTHSTAPGDADSV